MKTTTATSLRKELFNVLERAIHAVPTRIHYKKKDAIVLSYERYLALGGRLKKPRHSKTLQPLIPGRILKALDEKSEKEVMRYMGLS